MNKVTKFMKNNVKLSMLILGIIIGVLITGGVTYGATTYLSSAITHTNIYGTTETVEQALNDLYNKAETLSLYKNEYGAYWTDNYSKTSYTSTSAPSEVYPSYTSIVTTGADSVFIKTTYSNGTPSKHEVCLYYGETNKVFCLGDNYWSANGSSVDSVKTALKNAMDSALGTSTSCHSGSDYAECYAGSSFCDTYLSGYISCESDSGRCVTYHGDTECY